MALLNLDDDPWVLEIESCERLQRNIMEQLTARDKLPSVHEQYGKISATIRLRLKQYDTEVSQLMQKLEDSRKAKLITADESSRRLRQIESLKSRSIQMNKDFNNITQKHHRDRFHLLGDPTTPGSSSSHYRAFRGDDDDDAILPADQSSGPDAMERYREDKQRALQEQERGLENLSKIISRQKEIAHTIHAEVDLHNNILDDLGQQIETTDAMVREDTNLVGEVTRRDSSCAYWVVIVLLFVSILVVAFAL